MRRGGGDELDASAFGDEDSDVSEQSLSTAELDQVLALEKLVEKGDWWAAMHAAARDDHASAFEAESFWDADHELTDHPIPESRPPRQPTVSPRRSSPRRSMRSTAPRSSVSSFR